MYKLSAILILCIIGTTEQLFSQIQNLPDSIPSNHILRFIPFRGFISVGASSSTYAGPFNVDNVPGGGDATQNGIEVEWMSVSKMFKVGLGAGLSIRSGSNWNSPLRKVSDKYYATFEIGKNKSSINSIPHLNISFNIQLGLMNGSFTNTYLFYVGGGPVLYIEKQYRKLNFSISPFIEYHGDEQMQEIFWDSRVSSKFPSPIYYNAFFTTASINVAIIVQYNYLKKNSNLVKD